MGLSFGPEALEGSVLSMRLGGKTIQRVRVTSLELQPHGQRAIRGTIKGELTGRADEGQPVYLAFVAVDANGVQLPRQPEAP